MRNGYAIELDELRSVSHNAKQTIAAMEAEERSRTGIGSLRIRYNNVFGYFIEVSKANASRVPPDYERRQTLANAERFTTTALKEWEGKVLGAEERILQLESEIFGVVCRQIAAETSRIQVTARALACLDAVSSLAETAAILHNATPRSLVLLDEIGRGTATFDGLSIAWAVAEYLHDSPEHAAKTLFATHYHELTELAERLPGAQNYQITATEREGEVVFLHRLERGRASKSYGIEVARLAGMPTAVLANARDVLQRLERYELDVFAEDEQLLAAETTAKAKAAAVEIGYNQATDIALN